MLKTLIIATLLLPRLTIAQQSQQLPQPGGWMASGGYECVVAGPTGTPLNVRDRPNGTIFGALHNDTRVIVTDSTVASGKVWSKVVPVEAGKAGWVFRSYLDCA